MGRTEPTDNQKYHIFTLSNGMKCVFRASDSAVAYCGVAVNAGSRDEDSDRYGLAHFVEHTVFKGTERLSSWHVSNRMESVGGELNAYTTKEETLIYANIPADYASRAIELLGELVANAAFPQAEVEREREVVIEEIHSYRDSPSDMVYDLFDDMIYAGSSMGHNILGTPESVQRLNSSDCARFIGKFYTPGQMVFYCTGPLKARDVERMAERSFGNLKRPDTPRVRPVPEVVAPFKRLINEEGHQSHTIVGARTFGRSDPRRFALFLLNNYLGGPCMNSRLNRELREKRGYVYTVDSTVALMSNCGLLQVYFGSDRAHTSRCIKLIAKELQKLADKELSPSALERIKRQYCGQLLVSSDHREAMAMSMGKSLLYYGEVHDVAYSTERIRSVSPREVREVAELLAPSLCSDLTIC